MNDIKNELKNSMKTGLIDFKIDSHIKYGPQLLLNNKKNKVKILSYIQEELQEAKEFYFSVAFITQSGLSTIKMILKDLETKGIKGKILTSDYIDFTEPRALEELLAFSNLEIRICNQKGFHSKGYIFKKEVETTIILGSSNLTATALLTNLEWNLKITSLDEGQLLKDTMEEFNENFTTSEILTQSWIESYKIRYEKKKKLKIKEENYYFEPNKMQINALYELEKIRKKNKNKALVISATGTGKTYLAAFDVKKFAPRRMLFVVHREQIINDAIQSFEKVLNVSFAKFGKFIGNKKEIKCEYIFATIQSISKKENLEIFLKEHFDYIIIDEVHRAGAESYLRLINYFKPKFLLGMSATPERSDNFNIYELFNYNLAYEIRLKDALEENMLCPFHYYGIGDILLNGELIDENSTFSNLLSENRIKHILENIKLYSYSGNKVRGLVFCSSKNEAKELSGIFNNNNYKTTYLTGDSNQEKRINAVNSLCSENGLDYIFTVDIFNEGIDIPEVNQIIMLRPTESNIVFVQQLGRGLRKSDKKDYVVVIDFIGNYKKNFLIPIALFGDSTYNKDTIRKYVQGGTNLLPGESTIDFDNVAKENIYGAIDASNFQDVKIMKEEYILLKQKLNKIPALVDFLKFGSIDPQVILKKFHYYELFLEKIENFSLNYSMEERKMLYFISQEISNAKRIEEIYFLEYIQVNKSISFLECQKFFKYNYETKIDKKMFASLLNVFSLEFFTKQAKIKYEKLLDFETKEYVNKLILNNNPKFKNAIKELIEYSKFETNSGENYKDTSFKLYEKYSRKEVSKILKWDKDNSAVMFGYSIKNDTCPIFITYEKHDFLNESTKYEDAFLSPELMKWFSRINRKLESKEIQKIYHHKENNLKLHLFIKKRNSEGSDSYYFGEVSVIEVKQDEKVNNDLVKQPIVAFLLKLETPVRNDIYKYITSN